MITQLRDKAGNIIDEEEDLVAFATSSNMSRPNNKMEWKFFQAVMQKMRFSEVWID